MEALEQFREAKKQARAAKDAANLVLKQAFGQASAALFEAHPTLSEFSWTQYTTYFNDGDSCEFSAHTDDPKLKFADGTEVDYFSEYTVNRKRDKGEPVTEQDEAGLAVLAFLGMFDEADYEECFGDHVEVTVNRFGATAEEYSHD